MRWHKDARRKAGGYWRCVVVGRASEARYNASEKGRATKEAYRATERGRRVVATFRWNEMKKRLRERIEYKRGRIAVLEQVLKELTGG